MHAAEAAGAHEADPDRAAGGERAADRRRPDCVLHDGRGEVARANLARVGVEARELLVRQPDPDGSVEDADRGRDGTCLTHPAFALEADRDAFAGREPVRDERRLERDHGASLAERGRHFLRDGDELVHGIDPSWATQRAAASSASSGPPTR